MLDAGHLKDVPCRFHPIHAIHVTVLIARAEKLPSHWPLHLQSLNLRATDLPGKLGTPSLAEQVGGRERVAIVILLCALTLKLSPLEAKLSGRLG